MATRSILKERSEHEALKRRTNVKVLLMISIYLGTLCIIWLQVKLVFGWNPAAWVVLGASFLSIFILHLIRGKEITLRNIGWGKENKWLQWDTVLGVSRRTTLLVLFYDVLVLLLGLNIIGWALIIGFGIFFLCQSANEFYKRA